MSCGSRGQEAFHLHARHLPIEVLRIRNVLASLRFERTRMIVARVCPRHPVWDIAGGGFAELQPGLRIRSCSSAVRS